MITPSFFDWIILVVLVILTIGIWSVQKQVDKLKEKKE